MGTDGKIRFLFHRQLFTERVNDIKGKVPTTWHFLCRNSYSVPVLFSDACEKFGIARAEANKMRCLSDIRMRMNSPPVNLGAFIGAFLQLVCTWVPSSFWECAIPVSPSIAWAAHQKQHLIVISTLAEASGCCCIIAIIAFVRYSLRPRISCGPCPCLLRSYPRSCRSSVAAAQFPFGPGPLRSDLL